MNVRIRTERHGKVALTMGAVVLTMPADEARALARAILHHADEADPVRADRAFGEVLAPDVPATGSATDPTGLLAGLNRQLARARISGSTAELANIHSRARQYGFAQVLGELWFSPIGKPPTNRAPAAGI